MPHVLAIAGGSASGKSTLAQEVVRTLGDAAQHLLHDRYYLAPPDGVDPNGWNFDHPDSLDTARMVQHLAELRAGRPVDVPRYDFTVHAPEPALERLEARPVVIVEGILVLTDPALRALADMTVFVDAPADIRLARRLRRDVAERGRAPMQVLDRYLAMVRPMHQEWVEPCRDHADLVVDGTRPIEALLAEVLAVMQARGLSIR